MELFVKLDGEGLCRTLFHVDVHDPKTPKVFCQSCESYVKENTDNPKTCLCCRNKVFKKKKYKLLRIMLDHAIDNYQNLITAFIKNPNQGKVVVNQKWKSITYEVPLDVLCLYFDMREPSQSKDRINGLPSWANKFYDKKHIAEIHDKGILPYVDRRVKAAWLG